MIGEAYSDEEYKGTGINFPRKPMLTSGSTLEIREICEKYITKIHKAMLDEEEGFIGVTSDEIKIALKCHVRLLEIENLKL